MKKQSNVIRSVLSGILLFALFASASVNAQTKTSSMYDDKCRLKHDTTRSISKALCETWANAENNIAAYLSTVDIPEEYMDGRYKLRHALVASFECDSANVKNIKVLNDSSYYAYAVTECIKLEGKKIAAALKKASSATSEKKYLGKYYVAFNFMVMNFNQQLKNSKAVPVIRVTPPKLDKE